MSGLSLDDVILDASTSNIAISDGTDTLAVNGDGSINAIVTATDLDIRDLTHVSDSVKVGDGTDFLAIAADGSIAVTDNGGSLTVDFTRLLDSTDSVAIGDGAGAFLDILTEDEAGAGGEEGVMILGRRQDAAGSPVDTDGDYHGLVFNNDGELKVAADLTSSVADDAADSGNPIKVGGRGVSGLLSALSATNDRFDMLGDLYRRQWVNKSYNVEIEVTTETVGAAAGEIVATPMAGRTNMTIQNASNNSVWLGHDAAVTADDAATGGIEIKKNISYTDDFGENIDVFLISDGAGRTVKVLEKG